MTERIRYVVLYSLLCFSATPLHSQANIDSLLSLYSSQPDDTARVRTLSALVDAYMYSKPKKAKIYIDKGMQLSHHLNYALGLAVFHNHMGAWYYSEQDSATYYYQKGLNYAEEAGDLNQQAKIFSGLAIIAFDQGKLDEADSIMKKSHCAGYTSKRYPGSGH